MVLMKQIHLISFFTTYNADKTVNLKLKNSYYPFVFTENKLFVPMFKSTCLENLEMQRNSCYFWIILIFNSCYWS